MFRHGQKFQSEQEFHEKADNKSRIEEQADAENFENFGFGSNSKNGISSEKFNNQNFDDNQKTEMVPNSEQNHTQKVDRLYVYTIVFLNFIIILIYSLTLRKLLTTDPSKYDRKYGHGHHNYRDNNNYENKGKCNKKRKKKTGHKHHHAHSTSLDEVFCNRKQVLAGLSNLGQKDGDEIVDATLIDKKPRRETFDGDYSSSNFNSTSMNTTDFCQTMEIRTKDNKLVKLKFNGFNNENDNVFTSHQNPLSRKQRIEIVSEKPSDSEDSENLSKDDADEEDSDSYFSSTCYSDHDETTSSTFQNLDNHLAIIRSAQSFNSNAAKNHNNKTTAKRTNSTKITGKLKKPTTSKTPKTKNKGLLQLPEYSNLCRTPPPNKSGSLLPRSPMMVRISPEGNISQATMDLNLGVTQSRRASLVVPRSRESSGDYSDSSHRSRKNNSNKNQHQPVKVVKGPLLRLPSIDCDQNNHFYESLDGSGSSHQVYARPRLGRSHTVSQREVRRRSSTGNILEK